MPSQGLGDKCLIRFTWSNVQGSEQHADQAGERLQITGIDPTEEMRQWERISGPRGAARPRSPASSSSAAGHQVGGERHRAEFAGVLLVLEEPMYAIRRSGLSITYNFG
jgi:hypothetical protein